MFYSSNYHVICKSGDTHITEFGLMTTDMLYVIFIYRAKPRLLLKAIRPTVKISMFNPGSA